MKQERDGRVRCSAWLGALAERPRITMRKLPLGLLWLECNTTGRPVPKSERWMKLCGPCYFSKFWNLVPGLAQPESDAVAKVIRLFPVREGKVVNFVAGLYLQIVNRLVRLRVMVNANRDALRKVKQRAFNRNKQRCNHGVVCNAPNDPSSATRPPGGAS